ncbi:MAG: polysaccharide biosynthesis C-terminal domain-containing protein, partial [bacterium]|nr:polysaccharide biosynthesis C-terminal domain-containing protein [bacterium]
SDVYKRQLRWLCCGQVVNACAGSVALLLTTTGHESEALKGVTLGAVINVIGNAILIPRLGITGAAIGTAVSTVVWNVALAVYVYKRLGINPTIFGGLVRRGEGVHE